MRVRVLGFASVQDVLGSDEVEIELSPEPSLEELKTALVERYPALAPAWPRLAVAVDGDLVGTGGPELRDGCEVALLPPVSGGLRSPRGRPPRATR